MKVLAGIVIYYPDLKRLKDNIHSICHQVERVLVIDNTPTNQNLDSFFDEWNNIVSIRNNTNLGIAKALNQILEYAAQNDYDWVLTLDGDSICMPQLIQMYEKYTGLEKAGMLSCIARDRNIGVIQKNIDKNKEFEEIDWCITSGAFHSVEAYKNCDGYDNWMFIDDVDHDYCLNLQKYGYKIYQINKEGIIHELGNAVNTRFFWRKISILNESAFRSYYIARNHFYLYKKYPEKSNILKELKAELSAWVKVIIYEKDKTNKLKARVRGIKDFYRQLKEGIPAEE